MSQDESAQGVHEQDMVMPGFRFHPTEEELVEFYLRRKVEGKRFNVELITFLDLYRHDPWELPALAAIGEKEWFFYVPRDRKYRNGDRPNRVTTSGYWKATGADRMIRGESSRPIGLKKTLVFYSGKAPKGVRTSWIMNEYRLPQHETERYQKVEMSLCRVYKRAGAADYPSSLARSGAKKHYNDEVMGSQFRAHTNDNNVEKMNETNGSCSSSDVSIALGLSRNDTATCCPLVEANNGISLLQTPSSKTKLPSASCSTLGCSVAPFSVDVDELRTIVNYQQQPEHLLPAHNQFYGHQSSAGPTQLMISPSDHQSNNSKIPIVETSGQASANFSDRLWDWNPIPAATRRPSPDQFETDFK